MVQIKKIKNGYVVGTTEYVYTKEFANLSGRSNERTKNYAVYVSTPAVTLRKVSVHKTLTAARNAAKERALKLVAGKI